MFIRMMEYSQEFITPTLQLYSYP